jgi:hypothetical protein
MTLRAGAKRQHKRSEHSLFSVTFLPYYGIAVLTQHEYTLRKRSFLPKCAPVWATVPLLAADVPLPGGEHPGLRTAHRATGGSTRGGRALRPRVRVNAYGLGLRRLGGTTEYYRICFCRRA